MKSLEACLSKAKRSLGKVVVKVVDNLAQLYEKDATDRAVSKCYSKILVK